MTVTALRQRRNQIMRGTPVIRRTAITAAFFAIGLSACGHSYESETKLIAEKMAAANGHYPAPSTLAQIDDAVRVTKLVSDASKQSGYTDCFRPRIGDELSGLFSEGHMPDEAAVDRAVTGAEKHCAHLEPDLLAKVRKLAMSYGFAPTVDDAEFRQKLHVMRVKVLLGHYGITPDGSAGGTVET
jgi:hypothetical protein